MKLNRWCLITLFMLVITLGACAPQATQNSPAASVTPTIAIPAPTPPGTLKASSQDPWDKVMEAAKKEGEVTTYSYDYVGDVGLALSAAFKNRYGIKMNIITGRGAEFIERLQTERRIGQIVADFSEGSAANLMIMKGAGLTVPVPDLPVLKEQGVWEVHPLVMDPEAHVLTPIRIVYYGWVNTKLVKSGEEPKSFSDLLKPEWKGKIIADDPRTSAAGYGYLVPLVNAKILDWEYVKALGAQDLRLVPGPAQNAEMVSRGEFPLGLMTADNVAAAFVSEGAPIKAITYKEGTVENVVPMAAIKGGPHPNAAMVLINWLLSEEGQKVYGKAKSSAMVRKGVPDFRPPNAQATATRTVVTTPADLNDQTRLIRERFIDKLWGK